MKMEKLIGNKIVIRDWKIEDIETYTKWQLGDQQWKKWDGPYYQTSDEVNLDYIKNLKQKILSNSFSKPRTMMVIADVQNDLLLGTVNSYWISKETNWLAAGIIIFDPNYWSHGIGKDAFIMWIDYLFAHRPEIIRLDVQTWSGNERMMNLALKLGFKLEGRFRNARIVNNQYFDAIQLGILRDEWFSIKK